MTSSGAMGDAYEVHNSAAIAEAFRRLQRQATREGRGEDFLRAARAIFDRLRQTPLELGEPLYQLPAKQNQDLGKIGSFL